MNFRSFRKLFNRKATCIAQCKSYAGDYKTVKRPDPSTLKMPIFGNQVSVAEIIKERIKLKGPMSVADYMNIVATNPADGYYLKKNVIGRTGDFITSPEISQLFGEILGVWLFAESRKLRAGGPLQIVELGPGNGTLLIDILRTVHKLRYHPSNLSLHLVEISETMQRIQSGRLCVSSKMCSPESPHYCEGETAGGSKIYWYDDLQKVPPAFSWFIAHEFFDVLPIYKFQKTDNGWREMLIDSDDDGKLRYRISGEATKAVSLLVRSPLDHERIALEVSAKGLAISHEIAQRVDRFGGLALIADYGHEGDKGHTFRGFHKHQVVDPLENPGLHDLTADVDFSQLKLAATKNADGNFAFVVGPVTQQTFLENCEAETRLEVLVKNAKPEDKENLRSAYSLLTNPEKMGQRFKFMAFYPSSMAEVLTKFPPSGFSTNKEKLYS